MFLLYLADNLAYFPYNTQEEPLFVVHHVDMTISVTGSNLLQQFKEVYIMPLPSLCSLCHAVTTVLDIACVLQILSASGASVNDDEENVDSLCKCGSHLSQMYYHLLKCFISPTKL